LHISGKKTEREITLFPSQAPINDNKACTSMFGVTPSTNKAHIVRAILESIAYRYICILIAFFYFFIFFKDTLALYNRNLFSAKYFNFTR
jgi:hypothetical protein